MTYKTDQRNTLLNFLQENPDKMFSEKQIEEALESKNISRSALYRNLVQLESEEKIRRCTKAGSREIFFQFVGSQDCKSHIHLSCVKCGKIFHMENTVADSIVSNLESSQGFEISRGETTIYGTCRTCHAI